MISNLFLFAEDNLPARYTDRLETITDEAAAASLYDEYIHLHNYPISWKELDLEQLKQIPELSTGERRKILSIRDEFPTLNTWRTVEEHVATDVLEILEYTVRLSHQDAVEGHLRWRAKFSQVEDYQSYARLRFGRGRTFNGSIVTERDPGEAALIDHMAGGVEFGALPLVDKLLVGQFRLGYGMGVSFGPALGLSKSNNAVSNTNRSYMRLRINDSSLESLGFTGLVGRTHFKRHHLQIAGALTARDGSWNGEEVVISQSGLHRTEGSLERKDQIIERLGNAGYWYSGDKVDVGAQYSKIARRRRADKAWLEQSAFGSVWFETPYVSHETGIDMRRNRAHLTTVRTALDIIEIAIAHRWYDPAYDAPYANGFGEYSGTANETGWYAGVEVDFTRIRWSGYIDIFRAIVAESTPPKEGTEWLLKVDWRPRSRMIVSASRKDENKEVAATAEPEKPEFDINIMRKKQEYEFRWRYRWDSGFTADVRTEYVIVDYPKRRLTGRQWAYKLTKPFGKGNRIQCFLVPYNVEASDASTYYFVMPVNGTMQLLRQTGSGLITGGQIRMKFSDSAESTIFYLQRHTDSSKLSHSIALQMDIAF